MRFTKWMMALCLGGLLISCDSGPADDAGNAVDDTADTATGTTNEATEATGNATTE